MLSVVRTFAPTAKGCSILARSLRKGGFQIPDPPVVVRSAGIKVWKPTRILLPGLLVLWRCFNN